MKTNMTSRATKAFEKAVASRRAGQTHLATVRGRGHRAIAPGDSACARQLCETEINGDFELEVIDVYQQPILARDGQIVATPTLVRDFPRPVRRFIGNLADTTALFVGLDLRHQR